MTIEKKVLLLYLAADKQSEGQVLKEAFEVLDVTVEELLVEQNYAEILDALETAVIPVVVN